jgi:hypothetical protein
MKEINIIYIFNHTANKISEFFLLMLLKYLDKNGENEVLIDNNSPFHDLGFGDFKSHRIFQKIGLGE